MRAGTLTAPTFGPMIWDCGTRNWRGMSERDGRVKPPATISLIHQEPGPAGFLFARVIFDSVRFCSPAPTVSTRAGWPLTCRLCPAGRWTGVWGWVAG